MNAEAAAEVFGADDVYPMSEVREVAEPQGPLNPSNPSKLSSRQRAHHPPCGLGFTIVFPMATKAPREVSQRGYQSAGIEPWGSVSTRG